MRILNVIIALMLSCAWTQAQEMPESVKLTGDCIGSNYESGAMWENAFDGDPYTYYLARQSSQGWVGIDLGTPHVITRVGWMGRLDEMYNWENSVILGLFEGANNPYFIDAVPLHLVSDYNVGAMCYSNVDVSRGFRYVRYVGPSDSNCGIAELEFYGYEGEGDDTRFYQLTNLPTVSIHTYSGNDPENKEDDIDANIIITYNDGEGNSLIQEYPITTRGRGNASWKFPKKPYRIKFNDGKSHHMLKGSPQESPAKAKKWTLINNYGDKTLMRNMIAFEMSRRLGMAYTPYCQPVDVIMNGEYKGCYQLCDQLTVDKNRVNVTETDKDLPEGEEPNITGGYLIEVDAYASDEGYDKQGKSWFYSNRSTPVTIKYPDDGKITSAQSSYINYYFNLMEAAVFSDNYTDEETGYRKYLDVESFLRHFIVGEFSGNTDTYWSTYMSKERDEDCFRVGPCWDFDIAFDNDRRTYPVNNNRYDWVYRTGGSSAHGMDKLVNAVLSDPYADSRLKEIWKEMRENGLFSEESMIAYVDSVENVLMASQKLNFKRWDILNQAVHENPTAYGSYEAEVENVRRYLRERIAWIDEFLRDKNMYDDATYYVSTPEQFVALAEHVTNGGNHSKIYLMNDLDMAGYEVQPIGRRGQPFCGLFDGQGHTIRNLYMEGYEDGTGVIGVAGSGAVVCNLILDSSCEIYGGRYVGIVGAVEQSNDGSVATLECLGNEGRMYGGQNTAGVLGCNLSWDNNDVYLNIRKCYNTGTIIGSNESAGISGWIGKNVTIEQCWNSGYIEGAERGRENFRFYDGDMSRVRIIKVYTSFGSQAGMVTPEEVRNGTLCYKLNYYSSDNPIWFQNLGEDMHPVFFSDHGVVYQNEDGTYTNGSELLLGDTNNDGAVDITDYVNLINFINNVMKEGDVFNVKAADANCSGDIDITDAVRIIEIINNQ